jgi:hypothetical protein
VLLEGWFRLEGRGVCTVHMDLGALLESWTRIDIDIDIGLTLT